MATRKRKARGRRPRARANPINPVNPTRRRTTKRRGRRSAVYARRRNPINPTRRRRRSGLFGRRRARRNPVTGVLGRAIPLVIGSALIGTAAPFVTQVVVRFAPQLVTTPAGVAATTFGTGWALSALARMFAFTRRWSDDVLLAGAVLAGGQLFTAYVAPTLRLGNGMGRRGYGNGMRGIGVMTGIPPQMVLPPPPPSGNGMQGVGMRPGNYAR